MTDKAIPRYFCEKCKTPRDSFKAALYISESGEALAKPRFTEVIKTFNEGTDKEFTGRKLVCDHFISIDTPSFLDSSGESLSSEDTQHIRKELGNSILNQTADEVEMSILRRVEEYQTLLKLTSKTVKQLRYGLQVLDEMREKFAKQLGPEELKTFDQKFNYFFTNKRPSDKVVIKELTSGEKTALKKKEAIEAVKALLSKKGYEAKDLNFGKDNK
jgi:hypothetical protein